MSAEQVNDGSPNSGPFYKFARTYSEEKPEGVAGVVVVPEAVKPTRPAQPAARTVYFVTKANGGLASARNFGVGLAHGKWVMALDSDDVLAPDFMEAVVCAWAGLALACVAGRGNAGAHWTHPPRPALAGVQLTELGRAGLDLHNSDAVNIISTDMGDLKGNALSWQPQDINTV
jgi:glycosyltransferase involved in cell wall biosynthesis